VLNLPMANVKQLAKRIRMIQAKTDKSVGERESAELLRSHALHHITLAQLGANLASLM
jgi:hypothetical protein